MFSVVMLNVVMLNVVAPSGVILKNTDNNVVILKAFTTKKLYEGLAPRGIF